MKPRNAVLFLAAATAIVTLAPAGAHAQTLTYVQSSAGLNQPGLDSGATELEFGDVNGDGHVDIVSVGDHGNPGIGGGEHGIMVWFGDGTGAWSFYQTGNLGYGGTALGDVNADGLLDIGYGIHHNYSGVDLGNQILEVALGDGTGHNWLAWDDGLATNGETWGMFGADFADVDHDGDLDIGSISFGCCAGLHVYRNNGIGTWTQSWGFVDGNSDLLFVFGDVNGDGHADFAAAHGNGTVYLGDGAGGFTPADGNLPSPAWRRGVDLGDVDDDGRDDLAFVTTSGVGVYRWTGPNQWQNLSGSLASIGSVMLTQIADMNLDGRGDVVAFFLGQTRVYTGDGQGNWSLSATITTPAACDYAALRAGIDVDHNGYPDLAFVAEENCSPWTGGTNQLRCYTEGSAPTAAAIHPVYPRGGVTWIAGSVQFIEWHAAVPSGLGQATVSLSLSRSGAEGPFTPVASSVPNNGCYQWRVPPGLAASSDCYLQLSLDTDPPVVVATPAAFTIVNLAPPPPGDMNCDGVVDMSDVAPFALALVDPASYQTAHPWCDVTLADLDGSGAADGEDLQMFVNALLTP